jgi:hypothetical protein
MQGVVETTTVTRVSKPRGRTPVNNDPVPREMAGELANVLRYTIDELIKYDRPLALKIVEEKVRPIMMKTFGSMV